MEIAIVSGMHIAKHGIILALYYASNGMDYYGSFTLALLLLPY